MIETDSIITLVVTMIVLMVGIFAFSNVLQNIPTSTPLKEEKTEIVEQTIKNVSGSANSIFNILGIVILLGTMMIIVGLVYSYISPNSEFDDDSQDIDDSYDTTVKETKRQETEIKQTKEVNEAFEQWKKKHPEVYGKE